MLTLYGTQGSGSAAVEAALAWAGLPVRFVDAASWKPGPGLDELAQVNPLQQIPTLRLEDGTVLTESAAILIHLGLAHPASGLLPAEASARALAIRGLVFIAANCYSAISIIDYPQRWCADAEEDKPVQERIIAGSRARLHKHWEIFADQFFAEGRPFLGGEQPGALDLLATVVSKWSGARKHLQQQRPGFHALLQRVEQHPRLAPLFARHWPAP
ncbi:glutathione S-transferase [Roseateles violae]|uniref:Glutathione S-transferase n=1 Tax=Roseateles violae TaxID=3058042 RepID=A0ABT8DQY5_9BURK|nr:glutathione S-transferase [Pelomonas sp. PFR6]MDN3919470.1 glutathione S-transferase [Pelomonas sp. PFR6]